MPPPSAESHPQQSVPVGIGMESDPEWTHAGISSTWVAIVLLQELLQVVIVNEQRVVLVAVLRHVQKVAVHTRRDECHRNDGTSFRQGANRGRRAAIGCVVSPTLMSSSHRALPRQSMQVVCCTTTTLKSGPPTRSTTNVQPFSETTTWPRRTLRT